MKLSFAVLGALTLWSRHVLAETTTTTADPESPTGTASGTESSTGELTFVKNTVVLTATSDLTFVKGTRTEKITRQTGPPSGIYQTSVSRITLSQSTNSTETQTNTFTGLYTPSGTQTTAGNVTDTATGPAEPTNTQPCNNYVELCKRKYSNITFIAAHNSPFVRPGNSGSNQELHVKTQLDDGVRFLQAQIQWPTNSSLPHFCHTSCDLLDAGPITDWLTEVRQWVDEHPYDVITILLGNGNYSNPSMYAPYIEQSGITKYTYEPPYFPMTLSDWPTLEEMIIRGKRVVMFIDYVSNQTAYPWLLDEFTQVWESPFDPLDRNFPCSVQRPPDLPVDQAKNRLYMVNHNLNAEFNVFGTEILVPAVALLNETNNATGYGSLGETARNCRKDWGRAPNFLNVDYYNYGSPQGSVFEVAAQMNNVTYDWNCCGKTSAAPRLGHVASWTATLCAAVLSAYLIA